MFVQVGDLKLDVEHRLLYLNGSGSASLQLNPMEARLLATLMESPGQVVSRAHLMRKVWQTTTKATLAPRKGVHSLLEA
jgi:DNA-binding response OmpR family regulator